MTRTLPIDHVVILVADLDAAIADYAALGFQVRRGGTHAAGTTHNALVGFADGSYLELIAFLRPDPSHRWGAFAASGHQGFVDLALWPPSVAEVVARTRAAGLDYEGPIDGGRTRPDGEVLRWQIGTPPSRDLPFLCGDLTPRALRVPEGAVREHPNGVTGIASATWRVDALDASVSRWSALLGQGPRLPATSVTGIGLRMAVFDAGPSRIVLVSPRREAGEEAMPDGLIGLSMRGPTVQLLPMARTHGAAIEIEMERG